MTNRRKEKITDRRAGKGRTGARCKRPVTLRAYSGPGRSKRVLEDASGSRWTFGFLLRCHWVCPVARVFQDLLEALLGAGCTKPPEIFSDRKTFDPCKDEGTFFFTAPRSYLPSDRTRRTIRQERQQGTNHPPNHRPPPHEERP